MRTTIDILLATYNGGRYLREQLDSIIKQSHCHWRLIIRDDGSSDDTLAIIDEYCTKLPGRINVIRDNMQNLGTTGNFGVLLDNSTAEYCMFSDQDDVWLPHKIAHSLGMIQTLEKGFGSQTPLLVYSDLKVVNERLDHVLADSFWKFQQLNPDNGNKLHRLLLHNIPTGCTMLFNRELREKALPIPQQAVMHDWWLALVAASFGRSGFLKESTLLYRQHNQNVIGAEPWSLSTEIRNYFTPSLRAAAVVKREYLLARYREQAQIFLNRYGAILSSKDYSMVQIFAHLDRYGKLMQKYFILKYRFFYSDPWVTAAMVLFRW